jgi:predicted transposase YbfD/YdcC
MPAAPSSPIDPAIGQLLAAARALGRNGAGILPLLAAFPDTRARRGVRHRVAVILGLAVCAVLAGARSFVAIAEWAADADQATLDGLGVTGAVPSESTFRRVLQSLDADALDDAAGAWAQQRTAPARGGRRLVAVDGKTLRGSGTAGEPGRHLLAALDHARGVVLGQVDVQAKTNEIPLFATLLDRIDLAGAVVTADAMHAQRGHAEYLAGQRRADYLITVKRNQPGLHAQLAGLPWRQIPAADIQRDRGHGRAERRSLKVTAVAAGIAFPHAAQAIQVARRRRPLNGKNSRKWSTETVYAVTSLTVTQASPAQLADFLRGHWSIEDSLHWVRDVTLGEDSSQIRTRNGPRVMASLRNLAITILRLTGHACIAAALRHHARRPSRPLQTITHC